MKWKPGLCRGYIGVILGIMENIMETTIEYWGYFGIMEKKMETTIEYWGYIGIMEKKMETTVVSWGYRQEGCGSEHKPSHDAAVPAECLGR